MHEFIILFIFAVTPDLSLTNNTLCLADCSQARGAMMELEAVAVAL